MSGIMQRILNFFKSKFFHTAIAVSIITIARVPQKFFQPQFFAEDGIFFKTAYESTFLENVLRPHLNYFIVIQRMIVELIVESGKWQAAPLLYFLTCIIIYAISLSIFSTDLYKKYIPNDTLRAFVPLALAAFGSHYEIIGTICNLQWYLIFNALHILVYCWDCDNRPSYYRAVSLAIFSFLLPLSAANAAIFIPFFIICLFKTKNKLPIITFILAAAFTSYYTLTHVVGVEVQNFNGTLWEFIQEIFAGIYYRGVMQNLFPKTFAFYAPKVLLHIIAGIFVCFTVITIIVKRNLLGIVLILLNILFYGILIKNRAEFISTQSNLDVIIGPYGAGGAGRYFYLSFVCFIILCFMQLNYFWNSQKLFLRNLSYFLFLCMLCAGMSYFRYSNVRYTYKNWWDNAGKKVVELKSGESMTYSVDPHNWQIDLTNNRE